ncbi:sugar transferase (plasmid) [Rhodovulum sp. MB263]|nr:sugar transferase [Rhodovulum sp. MB263]
MTLYLTDLNADASARPVLGAFSVRRPVEGWGAYRKVFKRIVDLTLVLLSAPFSVPLIALLALLVALDGHNPFYTQLRVGRNGRYFRIWKLRSMVPDADRILEAYLARNPAARQEWNATQKLRHDPRITRIGRVLRKLSLDELPQLFNVFNGTMALVGPRPMMVKQQLFYPGQAYYRLRPGITGLWQVSDRNDCDFVGRVDYDELYDRNMSLQTDLSVLFRTVSVVVRATGY